MSELPSDMLDARDAESFDASSSSSSLSGAKRKRDEHVAWLAAAAASSLQGDVSSSDAMSAAGDVNGIAVVDYDDDDDVDEPSDSTGAADDGSADADESSGDGNSSSTNTADTTATTTTSSALIGAESFPSMFFSWDELDQYIHEFGANTYQVFRKRTSVTAAMRNSAIRKRIDARKGTRTFRSRPELIPETWRFYAKTYVCTHGLKSNPRGEGLRTHASIRDTGCTAKIHATLKFQATERFFYVRARVTGAHNHPIGKDQYYSYAENRRITDPAVLRDIHDMSARGEFPKVILAHIAKRMRETTGEECVYKLKDIRNIIMRLKTERKEVFVAPDSSASGVSTFGASEAVGASAAEATTGGDSTIEQLAQSAGLSGARFPSLSPPPAAASPSMAAPSQDAGSASSSGAVTDAATPAVSLARLEILLDASYTYNQAHHVIDHVAIGATEMVPKTISGFKFEVVPLAPATCTDVAFVLPKHALAGCEAAVVEYCRTHGFLPHAVGVTLPVKSPGPPQLPFELATLSSRQLLVMKKFYFARHYVSETAKSLAWIRAARFSAYPSAPFDEFASYTKDLFVHALELMPLTRVVVRGSCGSASAPIGFTDTIYAPKLLKFSSDASIDADCVKAVLLHMHARFHATASFVSPSFAFEPDVLTRRAKASAYGAFQRPKDFVAGLSQLQSSRWGSFVLDASKQMCYLCAPTALEYDELQQTVGELLASVQVTATFENASSPPASAAAHDSGVLALLFVECMLQNATWGDSPIDSFAYFRVRYLMHAIKVVNKQDVHDIVW